MPSETKVESKKRTRGRKPTIEALPRGLTQTAIATVLGVDPRTVARWTAEGMPRDEDGRYDLIESVAWARECRWEHRADAEDAVPIELSRARKEAAEAELAQLKLARERGQLMTVEQFDRVVTEAYGAVKAQLLTLPGRAAPDFVGVNDQRTARDLLRRHVNETLEALVKGFDDDGD